MSGRGRSRAVRPSPWLPRRGPSGAIRELEARADAAMERLEVARDAAWRRRLRLEEARLRIFSALAAWRIGVMTANEVSAIIALAEREVSEGNQ